jgi:hypothetical protein
VRDAIMRAGAGFGLLGGLWWGIKHPQHAATCPSHRPANLAIQHAGHCISNTIAAVAGHWTVVLGVGFVVGGAAGLALAPLVRMPRRN